MAVELSQEQLDRLLTVKQFAELKNTTAGVIRREAKKENIPGMYRPWKTMGFDPIESAGWVAPDGAQKIVREDGRRKFTAWLNEEEVMTLTELGIEVEDPRVAAKARRDARKAAASSAPTVVAVTGETSGAAEDLFSEFGN